MTESVATKKRGRKAKSSFYHTRWHKVGLNVERTAEILGVTCDDILSFDEHGNPLAEKYLILWDAKHINHDGWHGWTFSQGCLVHKRLRFRPEQILKTRENLETIEKLELQLRKLERWSGIIHLVASLLRRKRHEKVFSRIRRRVNYIGQ